MSKELIESIIDNNLIDAHDIFKARMDHIRECKLYENKRMIQVEMTKSELEARKAAGWPRASDVYPVTRGSSNVKKPPTGKGDEVGSLMSKLGSQWKTAKFGERRQAVRMIQQAAKQFHAAGAPSEPSTAKPEAKPADASAMKRSSQAAPEGPDLSFMKKSSKDVPRDMGVLKFATKSGAKGLSGGARLKSMNVIDRYMSDRAKAKDLAARGHGTALKRLDKAYGAKRLPALGAAVVKKVGSGLASFGREVGSLGE